MAITWTVNITNVNVVDKRADVSFNLKARGDLECQ